MSDERPLNRPRTLLLCLLAVIIVALVVMAELPSAPLMQAWETVAYEQAIIVRDAPDGTMVSERMLSKRYDWLPGPDERPLRAAGRQGPRP